MAAVGIGTNNFGARMPDEAVPQVVEAALDAGINLFDTADTYGGGESERLLGRALRGHRDEALIATKFGMVRRGEDPAQRRGSAEYVRDAAEQSLRRLGVETIDLYQIHQPDPETPIEETLGALQELVVAGKVRWIGCSNFAAWQLTDAQWTARSRGWSQLICAQDQYSLLHREPEAELLPALDHFRMGLLPYFPLARGLLTGKYHRGQPAPQGTRLAGAGAGAALEDQAQFDVIEALERFAEQRGISLLQVAVGALLGRHQVSCVIAGATSQEQVRANAAAASWVAGEEDWAELDRITSGAAGARS